MAKDEHGENTVAMAYQAEVILDSIGPQGNRLTTMEFTLPKLWLAEFNTHCMFARNSASTRAIPLAKQIEMMLADPFIPFEWPLEMPGMSAKHNVNNGYEITRLIGIWEQAMLDSLSHVRVMARYGIHKQLAGRLLEPWRYQTVLVTGDAASYANFFHQRRDKNAAPEIRAAANGIWEKYSASKPVKLEAGEWHMPLLRGEDHRELFKVPIHPSLYKLVNNQSLAMMKRISAARCARLSYLTHHGIRDIKEDYNLFSKLVAGGHWSPLEHVCQALPVQGALRSWILKKLNAVEAGHGKWPGWHQFRKDFPNEYVKQYCG